MSLTPLSQTSLKRYEDRERILTENLLKKFGNIQSYSFTNARLCYDFWMKLNDKTYLGEIKVRSFNINQYDTYFLETAKLNNLLESAKIRDLGIVYVNFFKTEEYNKWDYIIFNLKARTNKWNKDNSPVVEYIPMNTRTFVDSVNKTSKYVIRLKFEKEIDRKGTIII